MLDPTTVSRPVERLPVGRRRARLIGRLRETLFELQCEVEPDPVAIDRVLRRLARVHAQTLGQPLDS
jgi:hypothetical protein